MNPAREDYSGFDMPELNETLKQKGLSRLWVGGLATEYCVKVPRYWRRAGPVLKYLSSRTQSVVSK